MSSKCPKSGTGAHWYLFETPSGQFSKGVCRHCGHVVMQPNAAGYGKDVWQWEKRRKKKRGGE